MRSGATGGLPASVSPAIEYVHNNAMRRGLCASTGDWKWSSWRYYFDATRWPDPGLPAVHGFDG